MFGLSQKLADPANGLSLPPLVISLLVGSWEASEGLPVGSMADVGDPKAPVQAAQILPVEAWGTHVVLQLQARIVPELPASQE